MVIKLKKTEDGIIIQLPLPDGFESALDLIQPENDVDGFHSVNLGNIVQGKSGMKPCTPAGVVELLYRSGNDPKGKNVVIVGRSTIVGKPLSLLLSQKGIDAIKNLGGRGAAMYRKGLADFKKREQEESDRLKSCAGGYCR